MGKESKSFRHVPFHNDPVPSVKNWGYADPNYQVMAAALKELGMDGIDVIKGIDFLPRDERVIMVFSPGFIDHGKLTAIRLQAFVGALNEVLKNDIITDPVHYTYGRESFGRNFINIVAYDLPGRILDDGFALDASMPELARRNLVGLSTRRIITPGNVGGSLDFCPEQVNYMVRGEHDLIIAGGRGGKSR